MCHAVVARAEGIQKSAGEVATVGDAVDRDYLPRACCLSRSVLAHVGASFDRCADLHADTSFRGNLTTGGAAAATGSQGAGAGDANSRERLATNSLDFRRLAHV
jgi:hypothetical protein